VAPASSVTWRSLAPKRIIPPATQLGIALTGLEASAVAAALAAPAALAALGYAFDETRTLRIVAQFERIETIAATIVDAELPLELESMSVFRP